MGGASHPIIYTHQPIPKFNEQMQVSPSHRQKIHSVGTSGTATEHFRVCNVHVPFLVGFKFTSLVWGPQNGVFLYLPAGTSGRKKNPAVMWRTMRHLQVENVNLYGDSKGLWRPHITWFKRGKLERWIEQWNWLFGVHRGWQTTQLCKDYHGPFLRIPLKQPGFNGK